MKILVAGMLAAVAALAQSGGREAVRVGQVQAAGLVDSPVAATPMILGADRQPRVVVALDGQAPNGQVASFVVLSGSAPALVPVGSQIPTVLFETWAEQLSRQYAESVSAGFAGIERQPGKATIHRYVIDAMRRTQIGYDITVEMLPDSQTYRISFAESDAGPETRGGWRRISPPRTPAPQTAHDGDMIALELYTEGGTGRRLVEYLHVGHPERGLELRKTAARDFYDADAPLQIAAPRLSLNGVQQEVGANAGDLAGTLIWCYVPGRGRFVLSLSPRAELGFARGGELQGGSLMFTAGNDVFRIVSAERMAPGSGTYNVYVLPDAQWRPEVEPERAIIGVQ